MIKYYDTHAHTNLDPLNQTFAKVVKECEKNSIIFNVVGTNYEDSLLAVKQAKQFPNTIRATIGFHPSNIKNLQQINLLEDLYCKNKDYIVAIGEAGLDYHYSGYDKQLQIDAFKQQIALANKYDLPLVVHVRDAHEDCLKILESAKTKILIHCFTTNKDIARKYIERGYYLAFGGVTTFKKSNDVVQALKITPLDKLLLETDCPWLAPEPVRGKTNHPLYIKYTFDFISKVLNRPNLQQTILQNSLNFFNWKVNK